MSEVITRKKDLETILRFCADETPNQRLENLLKFAAKKGMDGWFINRAVGPYYDTDKQDHIYCVYLYKMKDKEKKEDS